MRENLYKKNRAINREPEKRLMLVMRESDVHDIDAWAIPNGIPSRSEALRILIQKGLEAARNARGSEKHT